MIDPTRSRILAAGLAGVGRAWPRINGESRDADSHYCHPPSGHFSSREYRESRYTRWVMGSRHLSAHTRR